jgi:tetratricopeptide (TPR) repeat protein
MVLLESSEDRARIQRVKAEQAVNLAMQSRWAEAAELNRQIIEVSPKDIEAHNRLGKALMETGKYDDAREAYNHTLRIDPTNTIAQKNIARLDKLMEDQITDAPTSRVDPSLFIEEAGRAITTSLVEIGAGDILARFNPGDPVTLEIQGNVVLVVGSTGETIGKIEPKLRQRLIRLLGMGNKYSAFVTAVDEQSVRVIIHETHRDPSMGNRPSFPIAGETYRGYVRDSLLRYDLEEDEIEDEETEESEPETEAETDLVASDVPMDDLPELPPNDEEDEN